MTISRAGLCPVNARQLEQSRVTARKFKLHEAEYFGFGSVGQAAIERRRPAVHAVLRQIPGSITQAMERYLADFGPLAAAGASRPREPSWRRARMPDYQAMR